MKTTSVLFGLNLFNLVGKFEKLKNIRYYGVFCTQDVQSSAILLFTLVAWIANVAIHGS